MYTAMAALSVVSTRNQMLSVISSLQKDVRSMNAVLESVENSIADRSLRMLATRKQ